MKAIEKLNQIADQIGFPFAINAHGYTCENDIIRYDGLQAWACEVNAEGYGINIVVFGNQDDIDDYDANVLIFNKVQESTFFVIEDVGCFNFVSTNYGEILNVCEYPSLIKEYYTWADGSTITREEINKDFFLKHNPETGFWLMHNTDDFNFKIK